MAITAAHMGVEVVPTFGSIQVPFEVPDILETPPSGEGKSLVVVTGVGAITPRAATLAVACFRYVKA